MVKIEWKTPEVSTPNATLRYFMVLKGLDGQKMTVNEFYVDTYCGLLCEDLQQNYCNNTALTITTCLKVFIYENITGYLKNHWTKHRLVCIYNDEFSMQLSDMGVIFYNSGIFENFL